MNSFPNTDKMADLLGDGTGFNQEDPAAEFLAREQSELAELGIDDQIGVEQVYM